MRCFKLFTASLSLVFSQLNAQLIVTNPPFPTADDNITITYNAGLGNGALSGVIPVYAHTGVITNLSETPTQWRHVVGNWGTADAQVVMTPLGQNQHSITIQPSSFYDLEDGESIERLAFVFRNVNGATVGRNTDGSDIFVPLFDGSFAAGFFLPETNSQIIQVNESIDFHVQSSEASNIQLSINGELAAEVISGTSLEYTALGEEFGEFEVVYTADNGQEVLTDTVYYIVQPPVTVQSAPLGTVDGINYLSGSSVILQLHAPEKEYVYVVGDFTDWDLRLDYMMNRSLDGSRYWLLIEGLNPGEEYRFQYHIDEEGMRIADIYSDKILDYWNDPWIPEETYPDLLPYPYGLTSEPVAVLQTNQDPYQWTDQAYVRPEKSKLIVYELLVRDFLEDSNFRTLIDTLDYLDNLGINAIQLMPINEFEGNISWGYNPSFYFAPDKFYGNKDDYKDFVNECHQRGIAVIMDIALNHSFGQNPQVRMYFDPEVGLYGAPLPNNPWFNEVERHDFNVGYDYNHESLHTRQFCKRVLEYWIEEYHIDGYRLDLSKGFTQNNTLGNIGAWNAYDQSRINILNDYANHIWSNEPGAYVILEHFANNDEETVLSNAGMMLWGNINDQFSEASMGYSSNLSNASYQNRGWSQPHLISYAESHDEERVMYRNLNFGNSSGVYNVTDLTTALKRKELIHTFLIGLPGPKMIWQFGELGYDYSLFYCSQNGTLSEDCKTDPKPIVWDYFEMESRLKVYKVYAALHKLKTDYPTFSTSDYDIDLGGFGKRIHLNHPEMNAVIIGNFNVTGITMVPGFQHTGTWYEYFSGEMIVENDLNNAFFLEPGEYRIYTDQPLPLPDLSTNIEELMGFFKQEALVVPNPFTASCTVHFELEKAGALEIEIVDLNGRVILDVREDFRAAGKNEFSWNGQSNEGHEAESGMYIMRIKTPGNVQIARIIKE